MSSNLGTRNLFCYFFLRSDHILTMQTIKNQNMAGTKVQTSKVWKCLIFPDLARFSGETGSQELRSRCALQPNNPTTYKPTLYTLQPYYCAVLSRFAIVRLSWAANELAIFLFCFFVLILLKKGKMLNPPEGNSGRMHYNHCTPQTCVQGFFLSSETNASLLNLPYDRSKRQITLLNTFIKASANLKLGLFFWLPFEWFARHLAHHAQFLWQIVVRRLQGVQWHAYKRESCVFTMIKVPP